ncbi:NAD(P)-binding domain-containing protein [Carboxylicivirga sediminis]|uniref:NAD(P)-binding domain-containing protein n=1 Tax=Carboxylicivirga sediminis TaxID=2006564 RepID=A0A941F3I4_9BACT|nr:NAD(P)-dependent oxidoreductase [Carboxylicivirga sediminis]MBR8535264.1 NAD(P)-binding domain-containing protein [Carboxylicivirga sediminis]
MMKKVLIMLAVPRQEFEEILPDWEIVYPANEDFTHDELVTKVADVDAIVTVYGNKLTNEVIDAAPKLKMIANFGAGYDNIDMAHANAKGIVVTNSPDPVTEPTAELAMGLMIAVARRLGEMNNILKNKQDLKWGVMRNLSTTLVGKQLGIVGMGAIGKALARRAVASGMSVVYHNRKRIDESIEKEFNATYLPFEELLKTSDVVSLNMPLTAETKKMIGAKELALMKSSAYLINTARGPVVDEDALIEALKTDKIAGAGLDVFENEPLIPDAFRDLPNVVLMPHLGTATHETRGEMSKLVALNIHTYFSGGVPPNRVN